MASKNGMNEIERIEWAMIDEDSAVWIMQQKETDKFESKIHQNPENEKKNQIDLDHIIQMFYDLFFFSFIYSFHLFGAQESIIAFVLSQNSPFIHKKKKKKKESKIEKAEKKVQLQ